MSKKTFFIILLIIVVLVQVGILVFIGINYYNKKTIELLDEKTGLKAVFRFDKNYNYVLTNTDNVNGKYAEIHVENKELNIEFDAYFSDTTNEEYFTTKDSRKDRKIFKEYKGKYDTYIYGNDMNNAYLTMLLNDSYSIIINIGKLDETKEFDLDKIINTNEFIDFIKSIKFYTKRNIKIGI